MTTGGVVRLGFAGFAIAACLVAAACGSTSSHTGGATPTAAPTPSAAVVGTSAIAPTGSTCAQFASGKMPVLQQIKYATKSNAVTTLTPNAFVYWVKFTATAKGLAKVTVTASTAGASVHPLVTAGDVFAASAATGSPCAPVSNSVTFATGPATLSFEAAAGTTYYMTVQFSTKPFVGQSFASSQTVSVVASGVSGSSGQIQLAHV